MIPQNKFLELVNLVLKTNWYTFGSEFYQQTDDVAMRGLASSATAEIYKQTFEQTAMSTTLQASKVWEKRTHLENVFYCINNLHQNIEFTMKEESNGEVVFLDTLMKRNDVKIFVL